MIVCLILPLVVGGIIFVLGTSLPPGIATAIVVIGLWIVTILACYGLYLAVVNRAIKTISRAG